MRLDLQRVVGDFAPPSDPIRVRFGQVTASAASSVSVTVGGSTTVISGVRYLKSYTPVVNDTVVMLTDGLDLIVLGSIA